MSRSGHTELAANGAVLVLGERRRYEGVPGEADFRITEFAATRRASSQGERRAAGDAESLSTWALVSAPTNRHSASLVWRHRHPVSSLVLRLLAIPIVRTRAPAAR